MDHDPVKRMVDSICYIITMALTWGIVVMIMIMPHWLAERLYLWVERYMKDHYGEEYWKGQAHE